MPSVAGAILVLLALVVMVSGSRQIYNILIRGHAPFIFSRKKIIEALLQDLRLQAGEVFYELGAGTAPLVRRLAKLYPSNKFVAVEYALIPYLLGRLLTLGRKNITWRKTDFYKIDLSPADYLYCFLNVATMRQLENKFLSEAKASAIIISYVFLLPNCQSFKSLTVGQEKIHFYQLNHLDKTQKKLYK
jgi:hypothetical protein